MLLDSGRNAQRHAGLQARLSLEHLGLGFRVQGLGLVGMFPLILTVLHRGKNRGGGGGHPIKDC